MTTATALIQMRYQAYATRFMQQGMTPMTFKEWLATWRDA